MTEKIKSLKEHGVIEPGKFYTFAYQSSGKKTEKEGALVKIGVKNWSEKIWEIAAKSKERLAKQEERAKELRPLWQSILWANDIIDKAKALKKEEKIRLWEDFETEHPSEFLNYKKAEDILNGAKVSLNEQIQKEDSTETKVDPISFFIRQYDINRDINPAESYVVEAGYIGRSIDLRNGKDRHLFLVKETTITEEQWQTIKNDANVILLKEIDTDNEEGEK